MKKKPRRRVAELKRAEHSILYAPEIDRGLERLARALRKSARKLKKRKG